MSKNNQAKNKNIEAEDTNTRIVNSVDEVVKIFMQLWQEKIELNVSQRGLEKIVVLKAQVSHVDSVNRYSIELISQEGDFEKFDPHKTLLIYTTHRAFLLETTFYFTKERKISFSIPTSIQSLETRKEPRYVFKRGDNSSIIFSVKQSNGQLSFKEFHRYLFDISKNGLSIEVNERDIPFFSQGAEMQIYQCPSGGQNRKAKILYLRKIKKIHSHKEVYRVGLEFLT